jgi:uncharacterized protein
MGGRMHREGEMNRVLITGGTGLIGRALADELAKAGGEVIILGRNPTKVIDVPEGVRIVRWDGRTAEGWGDLVDGATAIVNLAGASIGIPPIPWTAERKRSIRDSRLYAGHAIIAAIRAAKEKPNVIIQSSAVGYYGLCGDQPVTEEDRAGEDYLSCVAVDWEASTLEAESLGVRRVIVRTGVVLSSIDGVLPWLALPFRFFIGGPIGSGKQYVPWIHIADQVSAIRFLIENKSAHGAYNLTAPNPLTNAEFSRVLARVIRRPSWLPVPGFAMKLALGEMADLLLLGGQRAMPRKLEQAGYQFRFVEAESALRDLMH